MATAPAPSRWAVVADVVRARLHGEGGRETRLGAGQFRAGAKVYYHSAFWGMGGETVTVIGHQRKTNRLAICSIDSRYLENWRAAVIYKPVVLRLLADGELAADAAQSDVERLADFFADFARRNQYRFVPREPADVTSLLEQWRVLDPSLADRQRIQEAQFVLYFQATPVGFAPASPPFWIWALPEHRYWAADAIDGLQRRIQFNQQRRDP